jgi:hypothetical protein
LRNKAKKCFVFTETRSARLRDLIATVGFTSIIAATLVTR